MRYYSIVLLLIFLSVSALSSVNTRVKSKTIKADLSNIIKNLKDPLGIDYIVKEKNITLNVSDILWRYKNSSYPFMASPIKIRIKAKDFRALSKKIAKPQFTKKVEKIFFELEEIKKDKNFYSFTVTKELIPFLKENILQNYFKTKTYDLFINLDNINISNIDRILSFYRLNEIEKNHVKAKILSLKSKGTQKINIKELFFPKFAQKNYNKFSHFYGPNCFHAALSFNRFGIEYDREINYRIEKNLNFNFINNYEFFNALKNNYTLVDIKSDNIRFGDIIVFYQKSISPDGSKFQSYKHGSAYIGNGFTYTKGSKNARHPYKLVTIIEDYRHWKIILGDIGMHVYRKKEKRKGI